MRFGIRIDLRKNPLIYKEILSFIKDIFKTAVTVFPCGEKGYIEVGFSSENNAELA